MDQKTRILIVEDDMIIAANISLQLSNLGYEVTGLVTRGEEAILHAKANKPDIILLDINLKGDLDGITAASKIQETHNIPIIYLTANSDEPTFARAKATHPYAFISKPFSNLDLQRTIALVAQQIMNTNNDTIGDEQQHIQVMDDRIFVRHNGKMMKLLLDDISYIEADRNYSNLITSNGSYLISTTLKVLENELKNHKFIRVHRSYMVNISKLDVVGEHHLEIKRKVIPLSKTFKEHLLKHLHTI
ncbi:Protein-glutamate methylesterase/protein-glutamine glutaminase [Arenibacter antarcticus]|uniref:Response regulator n=1 Tax=Arenibacter antarcticus TaxID=2040469 RepID=A0ABW5VJH6_9FLAO|nr:response regulator [Arenibacter sp. H213]MCM4169144.1 DNA-binding response regulator [Arenibacter sp. H213]